MNKIRDRTAFLEERIHQLTTFFSQKNTRPVIADFSLEKSLLFARQNLSARDFDAYKKQYLKVSEGLPQPDLVLFLVQSVPQLQKTLKNAEETLNRTSAMTTYKRLKLAIYNGKKTAH